MRGWGGVPVLSLQKQRFLHCSLLFNNLQTSPSRIAIFAFKFSKFSEHHSQTIVVGFILFYVCLINFSHKNNTRWLYLNCISCYTLLNINRKEFKTSASMYVLSVILALADVANVSIWSWRLECIGKSEKHLFPPEAAAAAATHNTNDVKSYRSEPGKVKRPQLAHS